MTHAACPDCLQRFSAEVAAHRRTCPFCQGPLVYHLSAADVIGYQRYFELRPDPEPLNGGWDADRLGPG